jgi:hypothetical protein
MDMDLRHRSGQCLPCAACAVLVWCTWCRYETFDLRIIHRRRRTGFEDSKEFPIRKNDLIAGRYQVRDCMPHTCSRFLDVQGDWMAGHTKYTLWWQLAMKPVA